MNAYRWSYITTPPDYLDKQHESNIISTMNTVREIPFFNRIGIIILQLQWNTFEN